MAKGGRKKSPLREKAFKVWVESGRTLSSPKIAERIGVSAVQVRKWRHEEDWDERPDKRPRGAPKGNQNAVGNKGGPGAPPENDHNLKHGAFSRFLPRNEKFQELLKEVQGMEAYDMLWATVELSFAKLIYSQRITFVKDQEDETKVLKKVKGTVENDSVIAAQEVEWEYQHAWDKEVTGANVYSTLAKEFRAAVKQFLATAPERDERRLKLEMMEAQIESIRTRTENAKQDNEKGDTAGDWADAIKEVAERRKAMKLNEQT